MSMDDEELRQAFAARPIEDAGSEDPALTDELWAIATGELTGPRARALVQRCARDPAMAELWRVTFALARESGQAVDPDVVVRLETETTEHETEVPAAVERRGSVLWLGAALLAAAAAVLLVIRPTPRPVPEVDPVLRADQPSGLKAVTADDAVLPRDAFVLRWEGAPERSHYELRVETEALAPVVVAPDLGTPSFTVSPEALAGMESGTVLYWRVVAITPEGRRLESPSHRVSIR